MEPAAESPGLPLPLEAIEWQRRKAFIHTPAAASVADEEVAVLNADVLEKTVRARHAIELTLPVLVADMKPGAQLHGLAVWRVAVCVGPGFLPFIERRNVEDAFRRDQLFERGEPMEIVFRAIVVLAKLRRRGEFAG